MRTTCVLTGMPVCGICVIVWWSEIYFFKWQVFGGTQMSHVRRILRPFRNFIGLSLTGNAATHSIEHISNDAEAAWLFYFRKWMNDCEWEETSLF